MRKNIFICVISILSFMLCSCNEKESDSLNSYPEKPSVAVAKKENSMFDKYVSNTAISTGNNYIVEKADNVTYRAYFPLEEYGEFEYCFYFSNNVDSTYDDGSKVNPLVECSGYNIISASVADGGTSLDSEITYVQKVTFDGGKDSKTVDKGERFWSDPITINIEKDHFLVWEWTVSGENIPCIYMSNLTSTGADYGDGKGFVYCDQVPMPQLIGCNRDTKLDIAAIGDSITQGCQTQFMEYEFWAYKISELLGDEYSFWNCGLGWSRTSDASLNGDWLERTSTADVVLVAFGTNDIISGEYGGNGGNTASEINSYLTSILDKLKEKNCTVIVFNAPPENYREEMENVRIEYNKLLKSTCDEYGVYYFDFASYLSEKSNPSSALYGGHPNGEGGTVVSEAFIKEYSELLDMS